MPATGITMRSATKLVIFTVERRLVILPPLLSVSVGICSFYSNSLCYEKPMAKRIIHQTDALAWLEAQPVLSGCSFITSMPDFSEFPTLSLEEWKSWFIRSAGLVLSRTPPEGVAIFYQRDSKKDGIWVEKSYLIQKAAEEAGHSLLWHKIICRVPPAHITFGRPAYSHLLCFSQGVRADLPKSTADVVPAAGKSTWARGMGLNACQIACRFILENTLTRTIVDPFCGHGVVLAIGNSLGMDAIGVELSRKRAERARVQQVNL